MNITVSVKYNFEVNASDADIVDVKIGSALVGIVNKSGYGTPGIPTEVYQAVRKFTGWNKNDPQLVV